MFFHGNSNLRAQVVPGGLFPLQGVMQYIARVGHDCSKQPLFSRLDHFRKGGASSERYPALRSVLTRRSSLSLSWMVVKPHHAGEAHKREAMVVAGATSWRKYVLNSV